jgi:hypothetical protein
MLDNGGETLRINDAAGGVIQEFRYENSTTEGWYSETDGDGFSLVLVDIAGDYNAPATWRSSALVGGSPGEADATPVVGDVNGDGAATRADAAILLRNLGRTGNSHRARGDIDGDRATTLIDLALLQSNLGATIAPSAPAAASASPSLSRQSSIEASDVGIAELAPGDAATGLRSRVRQSRNDRSAGTSDVRLRDDALRSILATTQPARRTLLAARRFDRAVRSTGALLNVADDST